MKKTNRPGYEKFITKELLPQVAKTKIADADESEDRVKSKLSQVLKSKSPSLSSPKAKKIWSEILKEAKGWDDDFSENVEEYVMSLIEEEDSSHGGDFPSAIVSSFEDKQRAAIRSKLYSISRKYEDKYTNAAIKQWQTEVANVLSKAISSLTDSIKEVRDSKDAKVKDYDEMSRYRRVTTFLMPKALSKINSLTISPTDKENLLRNFKWAKTQLTSERLPAGDYAHDIIKVRGIWAFSNMFSGNGVWETFAMSNEAHNYFIAAERSYDDYANVKKIAEWQDKVISLVFNSSVQQFFAKRAKGTGKKDAKVKDTKTWRESAASMQGSLDKIANDFRRHNLNIKSGSWSSESYPYVNQFIQLINMMMHGISWTNEGQFTLATNIWGKDEIFRASGTLGKILSLINELKDYKFDKPKSSHSKGVTSSEVMKEPRYVQLWTQLDNAFKLLSSNWSSIPVIAKELEVMKRRGKDSIKKSKDSILNDKVVEATIRLTPSQANQKIKKLEAELKEIASYKRSIVFGNESDRRKKAGFQHFNAQIVKIKEEIEALKSHTKDSKSNDADETLKCELCGKNYSKKHAAKTNWSFNICNKCLPTKDSKVKDSPKLEKIVDQIEALMKKYQSAKQIDKAKIFSQMQALENERRRETSAIREQKTEAKKKSKDSRSTPEAMDKLKEELYNKAKKSGSTNWSAWVFLHGEKYLNGYDDRDLAHIGIGRRKQGKTYTYFTTKGLY